MKKIAVVALLLACLCTIIGCSGGTVGAKTNPTQTGSVNPTGPK